jgi:membrane protease YdiL (CAAX protease family)
MQELLVTSAIRNDCLLGEVGVWLLCIPMPTIVGLICALFGLCHIIDGNLARMKVAFFGLFAGWLRERSPSIAVPATYHGIANILYDFLQRSLY